MISCTDSKKSQNHPEWDLEWIENVYSLILECSNKSCGEIVSSCGIGFSVKWNLIMIHILETLTKSS